MKKIDELNLRMDELATKLGPDYVQLIGGLDDIDPDSKEAHDIGSALVSARQVVCEIARSQLSALNSNN